MKTFGEKLTDMMIMEKVLKTLTSKFNHIVSVIEESKNLEAMKVKELQGSLKAHMPRLNERNTKILEQPLQV